MVPGGDAPENINTLFTIKAVRNWLRDLYETEEPATYEIGVSHRFWDFFLVLHQRVIAAGGWVKNERGELLIIERNGKLDMPKGKLEKKEVIEECAVREVAEECKLPGCEITSPPVLTYHCYKDNGEFVMKTTYWFAMKHPGKKNLKPQKEEGITAVYWASPELLKTRMSVMPSYNSLQAVFEEFVAQG